jgi:hypothetical protein
MFGEWVLEGDLLSIQMDLIEGARTLGGAAIRGGNFTALRREGTEAGAEQTKRNSKPESAERAEATEQSRTSTRNH